MDIVQSIVSIDLDLQYLTENGAQTDPWFRVQPVQVQVPVASDFHAPPSYALIDLTHASRRDRLSRSNTASSFCASHASRVRSSVFFTAARSSRRMMSAILDAFCYQPSTERNILFHSTTHTEECLGNFVMEAWSVFLYVTFSCRDRLRLMG